ncbi:MAG: hypothetical protein H6965_13025 [Chromatiaceae bacterium]|nr:hypothetical protein [Chromatiaceae bacterium]
MNVVDPPATAKHRVISISFLFIDIEFTPCKPESIVKGAVQPASKPNSAGICGYLGEMGGNIIGTTTTTIGKGMGSFRTILSFSSF